MFGKTLTLSMLQHFFAEEVSGQPTKGLFDGLKISNHPEVMRYQGQYPVIFLTLKEVRGKNFDEAFAMMKGVLSRLFLTHWYLLEANFMKGIQKRTFERIVNKEADEEEYKNALLSLSTLLYQHTEKKVIVLLDEYDTPLNAAYDKYLDEITIFMKNLLSAALKTNNFLEKGVFSRFFNRRVWIEGVLSHRRQGSALCAASGVGCCFPGGYRRFHRRRFDDGGGQKREGSLLQSSWQAE